jgi:hypothetical protein
MIFIGKGAGFFRTFRVKDTSELRFFYMARDQGRRDDKYSRGISWRAV